MARIILCPSPRAGELSRQAKGTGMGIKLGCPAMGAAREKRPPVLSPGPHSQDTVATFPSAPFGLLSRWVLQCPGLGLGWVFRTLWPLKPLLPRGSYRDCERWFPDSLLYLVVFGVRVLS